MPHSPSPPPDPADATALTTRRFSRLVPQAIVIGASTGGPQALATLLQGIAPGIVRVPVLVVLHMPSDFTSVVAAHMSRVTGVDTHEARHGEPLRAGVIYFAPGGKHLRVSRIGASIILCHNDGPAENFCKPAVDVLFRSAATAFGTGALGIVLTGMGTDGLAGSRAIVEAGGSIIVQDQPSSVVWGMPGVVAREGLASAILPIDTMASTVSTLVRGGRAGIAA